MAAYAALVSLMNNIEQIKNHTRLPIHFDQNQSETLLEKVIFLIDFLENYNYSSRVCKEMEDLETRITDAAYAAEDIIETHVVDKIHAHSKEENETTEKNPTLQGIQKVMEDMDVIKMEAMKLKHKQKEKEDPRPNNPITGSLISSVPAGKNTMVGFDDELKRITDRLFSHQTSRQVIPIVGMGGMGKTTLAKTVYEKPSKHFDYCGWVSISQEYDFRKILLGLLRCVSSDMSDNELEVELHKKLSKRRYLIVLDDMWSIEAWDGINLFLPDNSNGSRIIVTTRISSVATHLDSCSIEMSFLDEVQSWNLFCEKVFAPKGCPIELEEVGRKIVKNCKGLPLSIVVIGGLLAKSERRKQYWEYIAQDTNAFVSLEDDESCMKILYLSYHNLPVYLKPCFLYMGVFPEDERIDVSLLINLWVAEGFLKQNSSKELEIVAKEYFDDLISRNLIIGRKHGICMIHDLLRNLCLKEAKKGKFLYVPTMHGNDELQSIGSQRRICNPTRSNIPKHISKHLQTLKPGFLGRSLICLEDFPLKNFGLLRVLHGPYSYKYTDAENSLDDTFKLVNLRFIMIQTSKHKKIPSSLCLLWNLQILIVRGIENGSIAPLAIWKMTELRHLEFNLGVPISFPDPPPSQQMNTQEGDATLKNLHTLNGVNNFRLSDEVVRRISNIKTLEVFYSLTGKELEEMCLKSLSLLKNLESLSLSFKQQRRFDLLSNLTFPNSLKELYLYRCGLHWEDMSMIASLSHLQVLQLFKDAFIGYEWVLHEERVFHCLKFLLISYCRDLEQWVVAEDSHFPCLEHLRLIGLDKLVEIPTCIGDIPTLQTIHLIDCSKSAAISAKEILKEQVEFGNVDLQVNVTYKANEVDDELLERLASDNLRLTIGNLRLASDNFIVYKQKW